MHPIRLTWLAEMLRSDGLTVVEYPGWTTRSAPGEFEPRAVMWHHDASAVGPSAGMAQMIAEQGNKTTPPPLSQCWVDTAGRWHVLASGRANHAGTGTGWGVITRDAGNRLAIGIETDHTVGEPWPPVQLDALHRGTAAILRRLDADPNRALCGHLEYAPSRKTDPDGLDMSVERAVVAALMAPNPATPTSSEEEDSMLVPAGTNDHISLIVSGKTRLYLGCGYGRKVAVHQLDFFGDTPPVGAAGVGGGMTDRVFEANRPGPVPIPPGASVAIIRYTADHAFTLGTAA